MKHKAMIEKLAAQAVTVPYPQPPKSPWYGFNRVMREVVSANLGVPPDAVNWDEYSQSYGVTLKLDSASIDDIDWKLTAVRFFTLKPSSNLAADLERLVDEVRAAREDFKARLRGWVRAVPSCEIRGSGGPSPK